MTIAPKTEFRVLTEPEVRAALADPDPANPIAAEVARLIAGYTGNFRRHVERIGYIPAEILHMAPRWPIEAVAMRLATSEIRAAIDVAGKP